MGGGRRVLPFEGEPHGNTVSQNSTPESTLDPGGAGVPILLVGVIFFPVYAEWSREREVVGLLETKQLHYEADSGSEIWTTLGITLFDRVTTVTPVYRPGGMVSDPLSEDDLLELRKLRHLRFLSIESPITEASLPVLMGFENIEKLIVHRTQLSENAIAKLRKAIPEVSLNRWGD